MDLCLAGILESLQINLKVWAVQVVIFIVTFLILSRVLFGRILSHIQRRETDIKQQGASIANEREQIEKMSREYEEHVAKIEKQAYDRMQEILRTGLEAGQRIIADAQENAKSQVESARQTIAEERAKAEVELHERVVELTTEACARVLDMPVESAKVASVIKEVIAADSTAAATEGGSR